MNLDLGNIFSRAWKITWNSKILWLFGVLAGLGGIGLLLLCMVPVICVLALAGLAVRILIFFARFAVVLEDLTPMAAFRRGWNILIANIGSVLILGIILVIAGAVFGFIVSLPLIIAVVPVVAGAIGTAATGKAVSLAAGAIFALVCCAIYVPVLIVLHGVYETWATSAWTLAYEQFIGAGPAAPAVPYPITPGGSPA